MYRYDDGVASPVNCSLCKKISYVRKGRSCSKQAYTTFSYITAETTGYRSHAQKTLTLKNHQQTK